MVRAPAADHPSHRLESLDALRGIAALAVVLGHSLEQALRFMAPDGAVASVIRTAIVEYANLGRVGVVAFFLVSGYVIPFSFSHTRPVPSFLIARFFRLYPAYWVSIAGAVAVAILLTGALPSGARIAANVTMVQAMLGQADLIGVYWTLFYELLFYALCLGAFLIGRIEDPRYLLTVVLGLSVVGLAAAFLRRTGALPGVPIGIPMFLAIMHLGTLARVSDRAPGRDDGGALATRCYRIGLIAIVATVGPIAAIGFQQHASGQRLISDVTSLYIGLALFLGLRHQRAIARPALLFLGLVSYSLYLFHPLCLDLVAAAAQHVDARFAPLLVVIAVPSTAIALSALVQRFVEAPANRHGKHVRKRLLGQA